MATETVTQEEDESNAYNFRELLDQLNECKDFILTIPFDQLEELKEGLRTRKAKDNYSMRRKGIPPPLDSLSFTDYPSLDDNGINIDWQRCVRVKLVPRKVVDILKMEIPSDDF
jgi:hypothetical protein